MSSRGEYIRGFKAGLWRLWGADGRPLRPIFYHDVPPAGEAGETAGR